jgi:hypothetical protein
MDVSVDSVSFREKEASASVSFRPKGGNRSQSITMNYTMERQGDEWHVKDRNMERHEQAKPGAPGPVEPGTPLPPGHPAMGGAPGSTAGSIPGGMSNGHMPMPSPVPPSGSPGGNLPAGHPQLNQ